LPVPDRPNHGNYPVHKPKTSFDRKRHMQPSHIAADRYEHNRDQKSLPLVATHMLGCQPGLHLPIDMLRIVVRCAHAADHNPFANAGVGGLHHCDRIRGRPRRAGFNQRTAAAAARPAC
jgi:hypothetical protein